MGHLAPYVGGTPRRALRFLNVYRVIKASLAAKDLRTLEDKGGYRSLMTQLAIVTGSPDLMQPWCAALAGAAPGSTFESLALALQGNQTITAASDKAMFDGAIKAFSTPAISGASGTGSGESQEVVNEALRNALVDLKQYGALARRYSF